MRITDVDPIDFDLHLRALPQPRARVAARHRRRLLRAPARRGDRVRHPQVRPRERRADHHLRDDEGQGRGARRRPRARHAVRRRRPHRQADSAGARHDAGQGAGREPGAQGDGGEATPRSRKSSTSAGGSRACRATPRCTPRAWSSRPGPITDYAPLYKGARDEITTQWNMKEVERVGLLKMDFLGLSTLTLIHDCARRRSSAPRASTSTSTPSRSTIRRPTSCSARAPPSASSSSRARACASCCARPSPSGSTT